MRLLLTKAARSLAALSHDVLFVLLNNWEGKEDDTLLLDDQSGERQPLAPLRLSGVKSQVQFATKDFEKQRKSCQTPTATRNKRFYRQVGILRLLQVYLGVATSLSLHDYRLTFGSWVPQAIN